MLVDGDSARSTARKMSSLLVAVEAFMAAISGLIRGTAVVMEGVAVDGHGAASGLVAQGALHPVMVATQAGRVAAAEPGVKAAPIGGRWRGAVSMLLRPLSLVLMLLDWMDCRKGMQWTRMPPRLGRKKGPAVDAR